MASPSPGQPPTKDSPFLPPAAPINNSNAASSSGYDLVGMTGVGKNVLIGIARQSDKHSMWIPLGGTVAEITAVSFDAKTDSAVIKANGKALTLTMRSATTVSASALRPDNPPFASVAASSVPAPAASPLVALPTAPLNVQEEKEMEARMLVTDLLEIGQQQRKAYEEAQRQAATRAVDPKVSHVESVPPKKP